MSKTEELKRARDAAADEVGRLNKQIEEASRAEEAARLEPLKALAARCHDTLCRWNHTDGCSWMYEDGEHEWSGNAHSRWLAHIGNVVNPGQYDRTPPVSIGTIEKILDFVESMKRECPDVLWIIRSRLEP